MHINATEADVANLCNCTRAVFLNMPTTISRETFESRIETIEAGMDARVASLKNTVDQYIAVMLERDANRARQDQQREDSRAQLEQEREKRLVERDKRIEMLAQSAERSARTTEGLKSTIWLAAVTTMVTVALAFFGTTLSTYYATQSSNLALAQTVISAFQQGQKTPAKAQQ